MPLNVSDKGGKDFKPVPQGTHLAICNMVVDLGLQESPYGTRQQLYIRWELPDERLEYEKDGVKHEGPMTIGNFYTASLSEKANLRRDLEGWRGRAFTAEELKGFDVFNVLGVPCQVTVTHTEKGRAKVVSVSGWPKGVEKRKPENPLIRFSDDEGNLDELPDWLQEIIMAQVKKEETLSPSAQKAKEEYGLYEDPNDDIPF